MLNQQENKSVLLDLVDMEFDKRFKHVFWSKIWICLKSNVVPILLLIVYNVFYFVILAILVNAMLKLPNVLDPELPVQTLTLFLSITTILVSLVNCLSVLSTVKTISLFDAYVKHYYNTLRNNGLKNGDIHEKNLPKLKAFVILRSKNPDFSLKKFYPTDESLTSAEVLKILYEHPITKI